MNDDVDESVGQYDEQENGGMDSYPDIPKRSLITFNRKK